MPRAAAALRTVVCVAVTMLAALGASSCSRERGRSTPPVIAQSADFASVESQLPERVRGMWVWGTKTRLGKPSGVSSLLESCASAHVNEVYLSVNGGVLDEPRLPALMTQLRDAGIRVEALMGDAPWYQPSERPKMTALIDAVGAFNQRNPGGFGGIHLDIEPHQLPENRVSHAFLAPLADTLREARAQAAALGMTTSADLPRFAFEEEGALFGQVVARPFVMLYELRDRRSPWLVTTSRGIIDQGYAGISADVRGRMVVGLRVEDYPADLDSMFVALDGAHGQHARYGGWAIHDEAKYRERAKRLESAREAAATCP